MDAIFSQVQLQLSVRDARKQAVYDAVKEIESVRRAATRTLSEIHKAIGDEKASSAIVKAVKSELLTLKDIWAAIHAAIGDQPVEAFSGVWNNHIMDLCYISALVLWFENGTLADLATVSATLQLPANQEGKNVITVDVETYLQGVTGIPRELSRLAMNCVRAEQYDKVSDIHKFINDLYSGFRLLNLRNDGLRRKFDGIKYEINKMEQVMYDIAVRKLNPVS